MKLPRKELKFHCPGDNTLTSDEVADLVLMLYRGNGISASSPRCFHPELTRSYVDVVSGTFHTTSCSCRFNRDEDICKDGEFWEEKVTIIGWIRKKLKG